VVNNSFRQIKVKKKNKISKESFPKDKFGHLKDEIDFD
jgi:hypothetical protein|tara:strand:+ start:138 stop:251 length:114 start_codon:yes stop_codon:yes gene_type:complete